MFDPAMYLADPHNACQGDLDRRWRRSGYLIAHGRSPSYTRDDHATWSAWRFRLGLDSCDDHADHHDLYHHFPAIAEAYLLYSNPMHLKRWEIEARLLANETDTTIASKCGISVEGACAYGQLFFDVRPRLAAESYIYNVVLEGKGHVAIAPDDHEALLKHYGFAMGGNVVDEVLDYIAADSPAVPANLNGLDLAALTRFRRQLLLKLDILLRSMPASTVPVATWLRLAQDYAGARRRTQDTEDREADVLCSIKAKLDVIAIMFDTVQAGVDAETVPMYAIEATRESGVRLHGSGTSASAETIVKAVSA